MLVTSALEGDVESGRVRRYFGLVAALAEREFVGGFRGNLAGALATFAVPLLMLATYAFVFSVLIPIRIRPDQSASDYGYFLFAGLIVWNLFADVIGRAPRLFVDSPNYVHRPLFPISALVTAPCLASFYRSLPWLAAYVVARWVFVGSVPATALWMPLALVWTTLLAVGVAAALASLGAVIRDSAAIAPAGLTLLFFLTPVLYPADRLADVSVWLLRLNPMAQPVSIARGLVFDGVLPSAEACGVAALSGLAWVALGLFAYRATRPALQDLV